MGWCMELFHHILIITYFLCRIILYYKTYNNFITVRSPFTWHFDINFVVAHDSANTSTSLANDHPVDSRIDTDFILDETFKIIDNLHYSIFSLISILFITSYNNCAFIIVVSLGW